jgi:hypothetical protein
MREQTYRVIRNKNLQLFPEDKPYYWEVEMLKPGGTWALIFTSVTFMDVSEAKMQTVPVRHYSLEEAERFINRAALTKHTLWVKRNENEITYVYRN